MGKNIQKLVIDMKEQKREVRNIREELYCITEGKNVQLRMEEERKNIAHSIAGLSLLGKVRDPKDYGTEGDASKSGSKSLKNIADECGMEDSMIEDLCKEYMKFADSNEMLNRKGFSRLLQGLCPSRKISDADQDSWWKEMISNSIVCDDDDAGIKVGARRSSTTFPKAPRAAFCNFEQFAVWYAASEVRVP